MSDSEMAVGAHLPERPYILPLSKLTVVLITAFALCSAMGMFLAIIFLRAEASNYKSRALSAESELGVFRDVSDCRSRVASEFDVAMGDYIVADGVIDIIITDVIVAAVLQDRGAMAAAANRAAEANKVAAQLEIVFQEKIDQRKMTDDVCKRATSTGD